LLDLRGNKFKKVEEKEKKKENIKGKERKE
jgi:hypothetical protein